MMTITAENIKEIIKYGEDSKLEMRKSGKDTEKGTKGIGGEQINEQKKIIKMLICGHYTRGLSQKRCMEDYSNGTKITDNGKTI